jgi:hypothetical protein
MELLDLRRGIGFVLRATAAREIVGWWFYNWCAVEKRMVKLKSASVLLRVFCVSTFPTVPR